MTRRIAVLLYALLVRLLPARLRGEFGAEAEAMFGWQLARIPGRGARLRYLVGALADVIRQSIAARLRGAPPTQHRKGSSMDPLLHDVRIALRNVFRHPGLTVPVVVTLALGIGLATAMAAVVQGVLLRPLPYPDADRLVTLRERTAEGGLLPTSVLNFADWREGARSFEAMAAVTGPRMASIRGPAEPARLPTLYVTADFFRVAAVEPQVGRVLRAEEHVPGGPAAVVVSHHFWASALSANPDLSATPVVMRNLYGVVESYDVVGVMPPGFDLMGEADVYTSLDRTIPWNVRGNHVLHVVGRLAEGATHASASAELDALQSRIHAEFAGETEAVGVGVKSLREVVVGSVRTPVVLLLVGALLLLASAFLNAAGALLARGVARQGELLVRVSLGATRARLLTQLVVESALHAGGGLVLGLFIAKVLLDALTRLAPAAIPRLGQLQPAWTAMAGAAALFAGVGLLLFGVMTALITTRRGGAALRVRGGGPGRGARAVWSTLIAAEVALALMLLTTAGVLGRSLWSIASADTGFSATGVITAEVSPDGDDGHAQLVRYFDDALDALRTIPDVESAGVSNLLPVPGGSSVAGPVELEGGERPDVAAHYRVADGGFFETMGIPLMRGRVFAATDGPGTPHVAVINTTLAERLWPGEDALGRRFYLGGMDPYRDDWLTVIGIVGEARPWSAVAGTYPAYYVSYRQRPLFLTLTGADFTVRGRDDAAIAEAMRTRLAALDPDVPVRIRTLGERLSSRTADRRFVLSLLGVFAGLALVLTAVGIWGVVSFIASRRTRDMGIRMALGARPVQVLRGLQREALPAVLVGMVVGGALAVALTRLVRSQLYGVGVFDPVSLLAVALTMIATAWCASWVPARRVKRLDPAQALRDP